MTDHPIYSIFLPHEYFTCKKAKRRNFQLPKDIFSNKIIFWDSFMFSSEVFVIFVRNRCLSIFAGNMLSTNWSRYIWKCKWMKEYELILKGTLYDLSISWISCCRVHESPVDQIERGAHRMNKCSLAKYTQLHFSCCCIKQKGQGLKA